MHGAAQSTSLPPRRVRGAVAWWARVLASSVLVLAGLIAMVPLAMASPEMDLAAFDITQNEEGVLLSYTVNVDLPRAVEDALNKSVPLFFVAEAQVFRDRWYWRDRRVAQAVRVWRIVYQPLTSTYRVNVVGGLSQNYATRAEAFAAISRSARWKIAEPLQVEEGSRHYVEFNYRLDTTMLPRPMQIGIGGQPEWTMSVERSQRIN